MGNDYENHPELSAWIDERLENEKFRTRLAAAEARAEAAEDAFQKEQKALGGARQDILRLMDERNSQGLTLVTLADMVLGEDAEDRGDDVLVKGVGLLLRQARAAEETARNYAYNLDQFRAENARLRKALEVAERVVRAIVDLREIKAQNKGEEWWAAEESPPELIAWCAKMDEAEAELNVALEEACQRQVALRKDGE